MPGLGCTMVVVIAFWVAVVLLLVALFTPRPARADDTHWCLAWAREAALTYIMHLDDADLALAEPNLPAFTYSRMYFKCLNADEAVLLDERDWVGEVRRLMSARVAVATMGTAPATATETAYTDPRIEACRRRFRSFDPTDNTVMQRHHKRRELCPLL